MTTEPVERIELPDGTFIDGPLYGPQMPRLYCEPERHREVAEGCAMCQLDDYETGCGEYQALDALKWAQGFGYDLDPWQIWTIQNMMSVKPNGKWAAPDCVLIVPRQNGKGTDLEVRELAGLFVIGEELIIHTSHQFKTSQNHFRRLKTTLGNYPALRRRVKTIAGSHGEERIELFPEPTIIFGSTARAIKRKVAPILAFHARQGSSGGRGFSCDCLVYDEAMILSEEQTGASVPTMSARPNAQIITTGSAGLKDSFYLGRKRMKMIRKAPGVFGAEWSVNPHTDDCPRDEATGRKRNYYIVCSKHDDRDDPRSWAKANPAFGYRLTTEWTRDIEFDDLSDEQFDIERLGIGQWPTDEEAWAVISKEKWGALANENPGFPTRPIAFAVDIDEDGASATISAAWALGGDVKNQIVLEIPRDCSRTGSGWVLGKLDELYKKHRPVAIGIPKSGPAASLLEDGKKKWGDKLVPIGVAEEAAAFAWFLQRVRSDGICHFGEKLAPTLWHAVGRAETRVVGDGGKAWSRRDSDSDITPVTSGTNAAYILNKNYRSYDDVMNTIG
ncbi:hypothetical protein [Bradyrhizobium sp.]